MVLVVSQIGIDPGKRDMLIRAVQRHAVAARRSEGCLRFTFLQDTDDQDRFVFLEEWNSKAELESHLQERDVAEFRDEIRDAITSRRTHIHEVSSTAAL